MTDTCTARQTDAVGAALDCELPPGHTGVHEAHTTPDVTVTWTGGSTTDTDPQAARARRRHTIRWLISLASLTPAGRAELCTAVEAELADADQVRDALDTMCAEVRRLSTKLGEAYDANAEWQQKAERRRAALSEALGLGTSAPWYAITDRAATVKTAAYERAELLESARDALSTAGQNGPHGDDWPAIAPGIEALAAERDRAVEGERRAMQQRKEMAEERYAWQERGDHAEKRADLADRVKRTAAKDAADALARAEQAEAAIARVREQVAEWRTWAGTQHAIRDMLRALGDTPEPQPQDPTALDGTGDAEPEGDTCGGCGHHTTWHRDAGTRPCHKTGCDCACGRQPDPGVCDGACGSGMRPGGHCRCACSGQGAEPEPQPETVPVLDAFVAELFATIRRRAVQRHPGSPS